ncbi:MAG: PilC/PilY family type IV pilus protein [Pseudomonadota bacterium]
MNTSNSLRPSPLRVAVCMALSAGASVAMAAPLVVSETPLFVASGNKPNVLLTVANSNSMDEDATGLAVGSATVNSKSEIARRVAKNLIVNYGGGLNMGLAAFQQSGVVNSNVHSSPYDVSFDPASYDASYTGPRDGATKKFREPNSSWPGHFIYYNVNLPFYDGANNGNAFCYSSTADASNNFADGNGWDNYHCFTSKTSDDNTLPTGATEAALGWAGHFWDPTFSSTDSDYGQGITDFGRFMAWRWVSPAWFNNGSPGNGYIHVPIAPVDATQANKINTKLGTSQFAINGPTNPALPLQNAGLTPLEGMLFTIRDYFQGGIADGARGGAIPAPPNSCGKDFSVLLTNGLPSVTRFGVASADVTTMLADATTAAAAVQAAKVLNYVVGFALPYGVNPAQLDTIAAAGGTGTAYNASDEATLTSELNRVFNDILIRSGAAGAVALNSGSIQTNSRLFQAKFNTGDWSGQLQAFPINATTGAVGAAIWDGGAMINMQNWSTGRTIITYNPVSTQGVPFRWPAVFSAPTATELSPAQVTALNTSALGVPDTVGMEEGFTRLKYLRGDDTNEGTGATNYRKRNVSKMGDIVNSSPVYVQKPSLNISDPTYATFKSTYASRAEMIYVGANDGMLHGFLASTGEEKLGFVPSAVYSRLSGLTGQGFAHKYIVDGSPVVGDIKFGANWRTILVGGLAAGGRGLFALDVTDPSTFNEGNASNIALWEFTSANDNDLGLTYAQASIMKLNNGSPGVVVGNGYNNTGSGHAVLFILNAQTGALIKKIDTGSGSVANPNGLSTPAVIDLDGNGTADYAYAGDLRGNVWKFDLTGGGAGSWDVAYGAPLYTARDGGGTRQPITSTVEVTKHPTSGVMVLFGTGRYIQSVDVADASTQSLYGIHDDGAVVSGGRADLVQQTITETHATGGYTYRAVTNNAVDYTTKSGWYMDLPDSGERVVVDPILRSGRFIVPTTVPSSSPCAVGGYSWLMEVDYLGGGRLGKAVFDVNQDGVVNDADIVAFSTAQQASGVRLDAISSSPSVVRGFGTDGSLENKYLNQSTGAIARVLESGEPLANRRTSWRQIL